MAEKILHTRILNKIDTLENWSKSTLKIKKGEICLATASAAAGTGLQEPVVMMKIGTAEEKTFAELPWAFYAKASDVLEAAKSEQGLTNFVQNVIDNADLTSNENMTALTDRVAANEDAIEILNGDDTVAGSVAKAIKDAIAALDLGNTYAAKVHGHEIADVNGLAEAIADAKKAGTDADAALEAYKKTNDEAVQANADAIAAINNADNGILAKAKEYADGKDGAIAAAQKAGDDAMAEAMKKVASIAAADASVTIAGTDTAPTVAVKLDPAANNALKLEEDGLKVVIPAAAEYSIVKDADGGDYAAVYHLTKDGVNVGAAINIPKDMVVKSGSVVGDEIVLVLNDEAATEIKIPVASLIEYVTSGSATGDMVMIHIDDEHKVTATITDGTITLAKLHTDVQTAINKAHVHENKTVLDGIDANKVAAWDAAEQNAKDYADDLDEAMNERVEALEAIDHSHANADVLAGITAAQVSAWDAAEQNAKDYADGLDEAMDARMQAVEGQKHEHANNALLDTYTQTEENLADAVAKKHAHANHAELDKFVDGDKAKLDSAVQSVTAAENGGLKATRTGNDIAIEIDESVIFVFDCGGAE